MIVEPVLRVRCEPVPGAELVRKLFRQLPPLLDLCMSKPFALQSLVSAIPSLKDYRRRTDAVEAICAAVLDVFSKRTGEDKELVRKTLRLRAWEFFRAGTMENVNELFGTGLFEVIPAGALVWKNRLLMEFFAAEYVCLDMAKDVVGLSLRDCLSSSIRSLFFFFVAGIGGQTFECIAEWYAEKFC
jgi:hypothetical protein